MRSEWGQRVTETTASADLSGGDGSGETTSGAVPDAGDSYDEGDATYDSSPEQGAGDDLDEGDTDYAALGDPAEGDGYEDPELSYEQQPDPATGDLNEPHAWEPGEVVQVDHSAAEDPDLVVPTPDEGDARPPVDDTTDQAALPEVAGPADPARAVEIKAAQERVDQAYREQDAREAVQAAYDSPDRPDLQPEQQHFADSEIRTESGSAYFEPPDREFISYAQDLPATPGEYSVMAHGNEYQVGVQGADGEWTSLDADQFADVVRESGWDGEPIRMVSCKTGAADDGFAQRLADDLDTRVTAATDFVYIGRESDGTVSTEVGHYEDRYTDSGEVVEQFVPGDWVVFDPRSDMDAQEGR